MIFVDQIELSLHSLNLISRFFLILVFMIDQALETRELIVDVSSHFIETI